MTPTGPDGAPRPDRCPWPEAVLSRLRAVVFDLDGVLVDTTAIHEEVWARFFAERGLPLPEGGIRTLFGRPGTEALADLLGVHADATEIVRVLEELEDTVEALVDERHPDGPFLPGAVEVVRTLAGRYRLGVATSGRRRIALPRLAPVVDLLGTVVTADDVTAGKPDPEMYLAAAGALGVGPGECLVVEDAVAGVEAANRAGALVVAVLGTAPPDVLRSAGAGAVLPDVTGLPRLLGLAGDA